MPNWKQFIFPAHGPSQWLRIGRPDLPDRPRASLRLQPQALLHDRCTRHLLRRPDRRPAARSFRKPAAPPISTSAPPSCLPLTLALARLAACRDAQALHSPGTSPHEDPQLPPLRRRPRPQAMRPARPPPRLARRHHRPGRARGRRRRPLRPAPGRPRPPHGAGGGRRAIVADPGAGRLLILQPAQPFQGALQ